MTTKHHGISRHRLPTNRLEKQFADAWEEEGPKTLGYVICGQNNPHDYTQRDAEVAASIIQWLGSPVGHMFLMDVLETDKRKAMLVANKLTGRT